MLCEINQFCNHLLEKHWPNVKKFSDINSIDAQEIPRADVWCGGFPCQDISLARGRNERLGLNGNRSGLFYKFAELISQRLPEVVVLENVGGLFTSNKGRDFGQILKTMSSMGYAVAWRLLNSRYFGVPQSRTRVYVCCWKNEPSKALHVMFDKAGAPKPSNERLSFITLDGNEGEFPQVPKVAYCLAASSGRHTGTDWSRTYVICKDGVRRLSPIEAERLQGFPDNWTLPSLGSYQEAKVDSLRYTAVGNAISIPVVEWISRRIKAEMERKCETAAFEQEIKSYFDFSQRHWGEKCLYEIDFSDTEIKYDWQKGGIAWNGKYIESPLQTTPQDIIETSLLPLIERERQKDCLYLSPNAAEGILRRVDQQNRTLFAPLRVALEKLKRENKE